MTGLLSSPLVPLYPLSLPSILQPLSLRDNKPEERSGYSSLHRFSRMKSQPIIARLAMPTPPLLVLMRVTAASTKLNLTTAVPNMEW